MVIGDTTQDRSPQKALIMLGQEQMWPENQEVASSSAVFSIGCTNSFQRNLEANEQ